MMVGPPFQYRGGKSRIAQWVVSHMAPHESYIEPFLGSGAVLLAKRPARVEIVNDLDGNVVNYFRVLRERPDELREALTLTPYARDEYHAACRTLASESVDDLERARCFFVAMAQGFIPVTSDSGWGVSAAPSQDAGATMARGIDRIAAVSERLRGVQVENRPAVDVISTHARPETLVYCDPPYVHASLTSKGYGHEMGDGAHRELAECLHATPATVLLSGYHSDLYDELYDGWHTRERGDFTGIAARSGHDSSRTEVLWSNRPFNDGQLFGDLT